MNLKRCTPGIEGHIGLAMCRFPAKPDHRPALDMSARLPLCAGLDYDHGRATVLVIAWEYTSLPGRLIQPSEQ